jgi:hypothetical protein
VLDDVRSISYFQLIISFFIALYLHLRYRSGYSYKDPKQSHILAIKMKHSHFLHLLSSSSLSTHGPSTKEVDKSKPVRIQWDPERSPSLQALPYRSIQIGISRELCEKWVNEWIVSIEDVTGRARELKEAVEEDPGVSKEVLVERGLVPREEVYDRVPEDVRTILRMD